MVLGYERWADASQQQVAKSQYQLEKEVRSVADVRSVQPSGGPNGTFSWLRPSLLSDGPHLLPFFHLSLIGPVVGKIALVWVE